ncbi:hypothetical protein EJ05DRAFT_327087 [Pseudovirgaria hyperparasitica]|uniref:RRM domain-containing protein n=1 Tax=Pseudovirgaria hyperparasitica TaxID=470096 RepID=A0A6A6W9V5_9PEZI|nr:uncharacterized protein EJ05DRAFT_327087 [Pseudovirgaria hyperparasitica]KAF2758939.1 hypothetical protein EJ05DRAFT_327087 [Pseudovirgaria hyperparasitica]
MPSSRPSPSNSSSSPHNSISPFMPASFSSGSSTQTTMNNDVWRSPVDRRPVENAPANNLNAIDQNSTAIYIHKLPKATKEDSLRSMLLFAKDLIDVSFANPRYPDEKGFQTALAHFKTLAGAKEAQEILNGKPNQTKEANLIVEVVEHPGTIGSRRNTVDGGLRQNGQGRSRYNGTFQSMERVSPPNATPALGNGNEFPVPHSSAPMQSLFSPTSPVTGAFPHRSLGKTLITNGDGDDDSDGLLQESIGIGTGHPASTSRRTTNPSIPISRFSNLSLNTSNNANGLSSPPLSSFASPRSNAPLQSPNAGLHTMSPHPTGNTGHSSGFAPFNNQHFSRTNLPPVNPADQNPPCNTLYVGNLPLDTSEDELKAMFSKQRGYKRLCFRTKQNGPMCFVEFEDVSFATKALNDLYGYPLHNSVKGGIRLSFSKNPLGVRTGQNNNMGPPTPMTPQATMPGMPNGMGIPPGFSTATGPPPGLAAPPGFHNNGAANGVSNFMFPNNTFTANDIGNQLRPQSVTGASTPVSNNNYNGMVGNGAPMSGNGFHLHASGYQNYMMGRMN